MAFNNENMNAINSSTEKRNLYTEQNKPTKKKSTGIKGIIAGISYTWINITEGFKGIVKGACYGFLAGTLAAESAHIILQKIALKKVKKSVSLKIFA